MAGTVKVMSKEKLKHNLVKLTENDKSTLWFVVSKEIPVQVILQLLVLLSSPVWNLRGLKSFLLFVCCK